MRIALDPAAGIRRPTLAHPTDRSTLRAAVIRFPLVRQSAGAVSNGYVGDEDFDDLETGVRSVSIVTGYFNNDEDYIGHENGVRSYRADGDTHQFIGNLVSGWIDIMQKWHDW